MSDTQMPKKSLKVDSIFFVQVKRNEKLTIFTQRQRQLKQQ